jgi:hypothetical protein
MAVTNTPQNGTVQQWIVGRAEPSGQFTAQVVGVPELQATAATRADAIEQLRRLLGEWLASGKLMPIEVPYPNPLLHFSGHLDPNDPLECEFVEELHRRRREDFEATQREDGRECPNTSSTPGSNRAS